MKSKLSAAGPEAVCAYVSQAFNVSFRDPSLRVEATVKHQAQCTDVATKNKASRRETRKVRRPLLAAG